MSGRESIEKTFFKRPNPKNGLELLFHAFDLCQSDDRISQLAGRPSAKMSDPGVRVQISALDRVLDLERESLALKFDLSPMAPVYKPGSNPALDNSFPVWAASKEIAKATQRGCDAWFGAGDTAKATRSLLLQIEVSHKVLPSSVISMLVSIAIDSIAYAGFQAHLGELKKSDLNAILNAPVLTPITTYAEAIRNNGANMAALAEWSLASLKTAPARPEPQDIDLDEKRLLADFRGLSPEAQAAYPTKCRNLCLATYRDFAERLELPEHNWPFSGIKLSHEAMSDPIFLSLFSAGTDSVGSMFAAIAKSRTQGRLLRLHVRVQQFRLAHGRLPVNLAEMRLPKSETFDPLANRDFIYTPGSPYQLASAGVKQTGPIQLRQGRKP